MQGLSKTNSGLVFIVYSSVIKCILPNDELAAFSDSTIFTLTSWAILFWGKRIVTLPFSDKEDRTCHR